MKKKQGIFWIVLVVLLMALAVAAAFFVAQIYKAETEANKETVRTYSEWTDDELFVQIPAMIVQGAQIGKVESVGAGNYIIDINGVSRKDYEAYLELLQKQGYELLADNGEEGIDGDVLTSNLKKDKLSLAVTHIIKMDKTYVIAGEDQNLSKFLKYDEASMNNLVTDQTMLAMLELRSFGNSFVVRLKNGHFIVNDGGKAEDFIYLIEYLESFMEEGKKPIIDCWVISHAHGDHMGIFYELESHPEYAERFYVEEMLFNQPNSETISKHGNIYELSPIPTAASMFRTTEGKQTPIIRPIMGQKYYYCDIVVEVVFSQEFLPLANYSEDLNDSSTWLMYNIEGQKALLGGDGDYGGIKSIMRTYDTTYFDLTVFTNLHHAINVFDVFTDYCNIQTVLVPFYDDYGLWPATVAKGARLLAEERVNANMHLLDSVDECMTGADGTLELYFPYTVGSAKRLEANKWLYHNGEDEVGFAAEVIEQQE